MPDDTKVVLRRGKVLSFTPRVTPFRHLGIEKRHRIQLSRFFFTHRSSTDTALDRIDQVAKKLFATRASVTEARAGLSEMRWQAAGEDQVASVLARCSASAIDLMLRALFEALHPGPTCDHGIDIASLYHSNAGIRDLMSRLQSFRSWLARDFRVIEAASGGSDSRLVRNAARMLEGEMRRLRATGYIASDLGTPTPYQIHVHKTMPHLGFLLLEFADRLEALELNLVTDTAVGDFAFGNGRLVRARFLPVALQMAQRLDEIPKSAERITKIALGRLVQHLFLATDENARPIDEIFERVFVTNFFRAAAPGTPPGRSDFSTFESKRWSREIGKPTTTMEFEPPFFHPMMSLAAAPALKNWDELVRDPFPGAGIVRLFEGQGIDPTVDGFRKLFFRHIYPIRMLLLGWYTDRLTAERSALDVSELEEPPAHHRVQTELVGSLETSEGVTNFFQWQQVPGIAKMDSDAWFIREPDRETVRVVITGSIVHLDGHPSRIELRPVEVRLPLRSESAGDR